MQADTETLVGIGASVFTGVALLPQLIELIREKKPERIHLLTLATLFVGVALWVVYGIFKNDWIIILSNAFSLIVNTLINILTLVYKRRQRKANFS